MKHRAVVDHKSILFVEDVYSSIASIFEDIIADKPAWLPRIVYTIPEAWGYLCQERVHAAVIDSMLPGVDGVPARLEGLHLAAWIRATQQVESSPERAGLSGTILPANRSIPLCLFTARTLDHIRAPASKLQLTLLAADDTRKMRGPEAEPTDALYYFSKGRATADTIITWLAQRIR